ncbi:MAG TPA: hypothetical protein VGJ60_09680, partial [Chloroflexota bacterium]
MKSTYSGLYVKSEAGNAIAGLYPGYFSLVMATGIVSIAALFEGWPPVAWLLFGINAVAYVVLWVLTLIRLLRWP